MVLDTKVINQILQLYFIKHRSFLEITRDLQAWQQELSQDSAAPVTVPTDKRTVKIICEQYDSYEDIYCEAYANDQTDQFFAQHQRESKKKPCRELSANQKQICRNALPDFLDSCIKRTMRHLNYSKYYEWLIENYRDELSYEDDRGNLHPFSYAMVMKYLKEWYQPRNYVE